MKYAVSLLSIFSFLVLMCVAAWKALTAPDMSASDYFVLAAFAFMMAKLTYER